MTSPRKQTRRITLLAWTLVATSVLAGCGAGSLPDPAPPRDVAQGGVDSRTGSIVVDDVWIDAPHGSSAGANVPLRLDLSNESGKSDALVGVSTPIANRVVLSRNGQQVKRIGIPAYGSTDLEWGNDVQLDQLRHAIRPARWFPVTLRFAHAAPLRLRVTAGPIGTDRTTTNTTSNTRGSTT